MAETAQHSPSVAPRRFKIHSNDLGCDVSKVYCYRARCACGWEGPRRGSHAEARMDSKAHRAHESGAEALEATWGTEAS